MVYGKCKDWDEILEEADNDLGYYGNPYQPGKSDDKKSNQDEEFEEGYMRSGFVQGFSHIYKKVSQRESEKLCDGEIKASNGNLIDLPFDPSDGVSSDWERKLCPECLSEL